MRTVKWSRETQGKTPRAGRDGGGVEGSCQAPWRARGKERGIPRPAVQLGEVTASLGPGLAEQANPRNLIFGVCKVGEAADNSLAADSR